VATVITPIVMLGIFLAVYEWTRRRAARQTGSKPPIRWASLVTLIGLAAVVLVAGAMSR
jgi:hypothetical protein